METGKTAKLNEQRKRERAFFAREPRNNRRGLGTNRENSQAETNLGTGGIMKKAKRKKSKTTKAISSAKSAARKTGAGLKRVAKKAARATGLA